MIEPADDDEAEIDWIRRAKSLWNLDHPGLVRMFEPFVGAPMHYAGCATGRTGERVRYLVMDLVDGQPLNEWIEDNPAATLSQRIGTLRMIAAALDMMHLPSKASDRSPAAHGDIKPSNILVQPSGASKLVDFGLARVVGARGVPGVGSLPYLAPELLTSADGLPTPDSDRFSFAATLFTVLTGALPPRSPDRGPDLDRTRAMLAASPLVSTREGLLEQVMEGLGEPAGRPRGLATWLEGFRTQTMTTPALVPDRVGRTPARVRRRRRRGGGRVLIGAVSALALLVGGGSALAVSRLDTGQAGAPSPAARRWPPPPGRRRPPGRCPTWSGRRSTRSPAQLAASGLPSPTVLEEIDTKVTDGQVLSQTPGCRHRPPERDRAGRGARPGRDATCRPLRGQRRPGPRTAQRRGAHVPALDLLDHRDAATSARRVEYNLGKHYRQVVATAGLDDSSASTPAARSCSRRSWTPGPSSPRPSRWARPCPCA